jgi:hypothetical protein
MPRRFVDLSIYLENEVLSDPPILAPKIEYQTHKDTLGEFMHLLPGTKAGDFPDGEAAAAEWVRLTTQWHPPRRAVPLPLDHEPQAGRIGALHHHR